MTYSINTALPVLSHWHISCESPALQNESLYHLQRQVSQEPVPEWPRREQLSSLLTQHQEQHVDTAVSC